MEKQVRSFIEKEIKKLGYNAELTDDTNLARDYGFDSLDFIEIILHIEQEYDIRIPDEEAINIKTYGDAVKLAMKYIKG